MSKGLLTPAREGVLLNLRVSPGAKLAAPPVDGKANAEIERFLAQSLGIPRSDVAVIRGASSRDEVVLLRAAQTLPEVLAGYLR